MGDMQKWKLEDHKKRLCKDEKVAAALTKIRFTDLTKQFEPESNYQTIIRIAGAWSYKKLEIA